MLSSHSPYYEILLNLELLPYRQAFVHVDVDIHKLHIQPPHTLLVEVLTCLSTKYTSWWTQSTATEPRETPTGRVKSEVKPKIGVGNGGVGRRGEGRRGERREEGMSGGREKEERWTRGKVWRKRRWQKRGGKQRGRGTL